MLNAKYLILISNFVKNWQYITLYNYLKATIMSNFPITGLTFQVACCHLIIHVHFIDGWIINCTNYVNTPRSERFPRWQFVHQRTPHLWRCSLVDKLSPWDNLFLTWAMFWLLSSRDCRPRSQKIPRWYNFPKKIPLQLWGSRKLWAIFLLRQYDWVHWWRRTQGTLEHPLLILIKSFFKMLK